MRVAIKSLGFGTLEARTKITETGEADGEEDYKQKNLKTKKQKTLEKKFLLATTLLYVSLCQSVGRTVRRSVGGLLGAMADRHMYGKSRVFHRTRQTWNGMRVWIAHETGVA